VAPPLRLATFTRDDFADLIAVVEDARCLLQWAGPEYRYPLDEAQLEWTLRQGQAPSPSLLAFKAVLTDTGETVGHAQLMGIDRAASTATLGRVLVFPMWRGRGLGRALVGLVLGEAFDRLGRVEVFLHVFAFNRAAVATYRGLGFTLRPGGPGVRMHKGEAWEVLRMGLTREEWGRLFASGQRRGAGRPADGSAGCER